MKQLNDYFRLKELDRIESEKKCLSDLKKVIDICIKKDFLFNVHTGEGNSSISVSTDRWNTTLSCYFKGSLIEYSDETGTMTMDRLLQKLRTIK